MLDPATRIVGRLVDRIIARRARLEAGSLAEVAGLVPAVLVTGGSRGIGRALAERFAAEGRAVVLVARGEAALAAAAGAIRARHGGLCVPVVADIAEPGTSARLEAAARAAGTYIDVLVNNAAIGLGGPLLDQAPEDLERLTTLNMTVPTLLARHFLPPMVARGRGGVLNIASLGGYVPGPYQAAYYASKAYLVSLTEALAWEVRGRGVRIAVATPGPVETAFHRAMGAERALYRILIPAARPESVARRAWRGFTLGSTVIGPGVLNRTAGLAFRLIPHSISIPVVGFLLKPRETSSNARR